MLETLKTMFLKKLLFHKEKEKKKKNKNAYYEIIQPDFLFRFSI